MESLNEDKSISVAANKDRGCLPNLQHTLGELADSLRPECGPSFHRDIDFGDWEALALEHEPYLFGRLILVESLCGLVLQQWPRIFPISVSDRVGTHIGERLDGERRVEAAYRRERRTPDHEQIGHVPTLAVTVDH